MKKIGGNIAAVIQIATTTTGEIGDDVQVWTDATLPFMGWLDLSAGDSPSTNYFMKAQESTHIFECAYFPLVYTDNGGNTKKLTPENCRMVIDDEIYEVKLFDDPLQMHEHLEIYLKYIGG